MMTLVQFLGGIFGASPFGSRLLKTKTEQSAFPHSSPTNGQKLRSQERGNTGLKMGKT